MDISVSNKDIWKLIDLLFNTKNVLYNMHYLSYQQFIEDNIITELNKKYVIHENIIGKQIYRYSLKFDNIMLNAPSDDFDYETIFPNDARIRHINYSSKLIVDIKQIQEVINLETNITDEKILYHEKKINIGAIPIMVRSKYCTTNLKNDTPNLECVYDPGCYFIIKGLEKVVVSHERICENKELIFPKKDINYPDGIMYSVQVNSKYTDSTNINITSIKMLKDKSIVLTMPHLSEIPIFIIFRVLGFETDQDIINYIVYDNTDTNMVNMIKPSLNNSLLEIYKDDNGNDHLIMTKEDAENYLIQKMKTSRRYNETDSEIRHMQKKEHLLSILENDLFSHMEKGFIEKGYYLGMMCNKLLQCILKRIDPDDRDNFINKRIDLPGALMSRLFEQYLKKMINECSKNFKKRMGGLTTDINPSNIIGLIKSMTIEQGFTTALATGNWGSSKKKGVAQPLHRHNYLNAISYFRRIITPSPDATTNKMDKMRHIHSGQYGFIDPVESPDGEKIGIQKHLALSASVTINCKEQPKIIKDLLDDNSELFIYLTDVPYFKIKLLTKVLISGQWYGMTEKPIQLVEYLRNMRSKGVINKMVGIVHNYKMKEIRINTDGGRLFRPLLKVKNNKLLLTKEMLDKINLDNTINSDKISTWNDFISKYNEVIEYIDCEESENLMIAMTTDILDDERKKMFNKIGNGNNNLVNRYANVYRKFTHCELNPAMMLGSVSSNIPFPEHNLSPRNIFSFSQSRQAMGTHVSSLRHRIDLTYQLFHPQIPLIHTRISKYTNMLNLPSGENIIVAIACYTGYNQEDSIIINKSSIDRGLLRASYFTKYHDVIQKNPSTSRDDIFMKPDPNQTLGIQYGNYDKLNDKGYIEEETKIDSGDFIIGKVTQIQPDKNNKIYKDSSTKSKVSGVVDKVYTGIYNSDNFEMYNVKIRSERIPRVGDKLCMLGDHEVLTNKGWIKFDDLHQRYHNKEEFKIATLHNGKYIKYDTPIDVYEWNFDGDMYKLTSQQVEFCVTMDHEMFAKKRDHKSFELIKVKDLYGKRYNLKKNGIIDIPDIETIDINGKILKMDNFLDFLGIYITINSGKTSKEIKIQDICNKMGIECTELYEWLNGYDTKEYIPDFVFELNSRQAKILLVSLLSYNETAVARERTNTQSYYTTSNKLADDIMRLAIHTGWSAKIITKNDNSIKTKCILINKCKNEPQVNHSHKNSQNAQFEEIFYHKGKVYCLEIPSHVFMIRYNNKNVWSGNCSRHGQKGSIGISLPSEDMPFTKDGVQPDIIINPCCIPSRMTVAQLFECVLGKASALSGHLSDATPFENVDIEEAKKVLKEHGFEEHGNETLYCGFTGKKMESQIFIGPTYYFRLKHMVLDKIHCLTEKHEVFTENGWKFIADIKLDDKVAILKNDVLVYENPIEVHHYPDYKGKMYRVKNQDIDLEVTANHRMYVKINDNYILEKAENIVGKKVSYKNHENKDIIVNNGIIEDELYDYEGAVYCLTVSSEIFLVRKNGKPVWTGNSRSRGPTAILTRQPTEGRAREGGLRFGEMERDAMISHGLSQFLKERFMETSDSYTVHICDNCGLFARKVIDSNHYICDSCKETKKISIVALPYAFKLMVQELLAINIMPRLKAS